MSRAGTRIGLAALLIIAGSNATHNAIANGDTRTISFHHLHTGEDLTITYKRNGRYDDAALKKIDWLMRDWRQNQDVRMDPHLIDLVWEVHRDVGSKSAIQIVCGYRAPVTNAMLRRRSSGVAQQSQHTVGKAIDFLHSGRQARRVARRGPAPAARRRRLLSDLRLAVRAYGRRQRAALAAHDA